MKLTSLEGVVVLEELVFVGGMPRAGSTLLMNLLGQNPRFRVTPTSGLCHLIWKMRENFTDSEFFRAQNEEEMNARFKGALAGAMVGWARDINFDSDDYVYIDKSREWIRQFETLKEVSGVSPKIIVPIRDLRGIASSMEKLFRKNALRLDPTTRKGMEGLTVAKRVQAWFGTVPIGSSALTVQDTINRKVAGELLFIRMEDLCRDPQEELRQVYEYIGEEPYEHSFTDIEQLTMEDDRVYGIPGLHDIRPTVENAVEDWDDILGEELSNEIRMENRWYYKQFYPERK